MVRMDHYRSGGIYAIQYEFETLSDGIPFHAHSVEESHNVLCLRGRVAVYGDDFYRVLDPGDILDIDSQKRHEIAPLVAGSRIINTYLYGMPDGYDGLPEEELHTRVQLGKLSPPINI